MDVGKPVNAAATVEHRRQDGQLQERRRAERHAGQLERGRRLHGQAVAALRRCAGKETTGDEATLLAIQQAFRESNGDLRELMVALDQEQGLHTPGRLCRGEAAAMNKWELSRRDLLKGLGVGRGLPAAAQRRHGPYGAGRAPAQEVHLPPADRGLPDDELAAARGAAAGHPAPVAAAARRRSRTTLIVIGNLAQPEVPGLRALGPRRLRRHLHRRHRSTPTAATARSTGSRWQPSIDQHGRQPLRQRPTPDAARKSLAFEIGAGGTGRYPGSNRCYWTGNKQPVTPESDPYKVYSQIFAGRADDRTGMPMADPAADKLRAGAQEPARLRGQGPRAVQGAPGRRGPDGHRRPPRPRSASWRRQLASGAGSRSATAAADVERQPGHAGGHHHRQHARCCGRCRCS